MGLGSDFKSKIDSILNNTAIRSTVTFIPKTKAIGAFGGYVAPTETTSANVTVYCIPFSYVKTRFMKQIVGNFNAGDFGIVIKGDITVTKDYDATWQSETYDITEIKPVILNDVIVANIVTLNKKTS
ncbi:hypothetical protein M0R04_11200 [Candidatus Dojkabacteria bacterium]|jgi:hypothetical protein|nr:hypothetical protein [Candidatus Dojkabacteria bacterium]